MKNTKKYVVGFMFNKSETEVILINKTKPDWQAGRLNGIGGKVEEGEQFFQAMVREFWEETNVRTETIDWWAFCELVEGNEHIMCYCMFAECEDLNSLEFKQTTEEKPEIFKIADLSSNEKVLPNLKWLIPLALDSNREGGPSFCSADYGPPWGGLI